MAGSRNNKEGSGLVGRPSKLTLELQLRITEAIRAGVRPEVAAVYAGASATSFYRWMRMGRGADAERMYVEFVEAVEIALAEWEAADTLLIGQAARSDWRAAAWRLERRLPAVYGRRERHEIANADESGFRIAAVPAIDPKKLTTEELELLIALTEKALGPGSGEGTGDE